MNKVSLQDYAEFTLGYMASNKSERFGQAFVNHFNLTPAQSEDLFYTENHQEAVQIIFQNHIDLE